MENKSIKWGILGAGHIAHKLAEAVIATAGVELVAVASNTPGKAQLFASKYGIDAYENYPELAERRDIDVIYVATTHNFHYENTLLALKCGKHVLVEKPFTVNAKQARGLIQLAREEKLFLMEAIWVRFLPSIRKLKTLIQSGVIGDIRHMDISFGGYTQAKYMGRLMDPNLAGGVTLDMGIYPITFANFLLGELPLDVRSFCVISETGVDELATYQFKYSSNCLVSIGLSFNLLTKNQALIYGTKGYIEFPYFQQGSSFTVFTHNGTSEIASQNTVTETHHDNGFVYQVIEVAECIRAGKLESPSIPLEETCATMALMDSMRASWGLKYPCENENKS